MSGTGPDPQQRAANTAALIILALFTVFMSSLLIGGTVLVWRWVLGG